ncbi:MAG: TIGR02300 family protein [Rhodospirillaceae bacterium]|nr:TIGR02300 family protein [Rhodospirillaceae bacterium]
MVKPEWGVKRICHHCGARFYDLHRTPILCPKCATPYDPEQLLKSRRSRSAAVSDAAQRVARKTAAGDAAVVAATPAVAAELDDAPEEMADEDAVEFEAEEADGDDADDAEVFEDDDDGDDVLLEDAAELGDDDGVDIDVDSDEDDNR